MATVIRDPISDHLITPQNSALLVIDYQPAQVGAVRSMDRELLVKNIVSTVKLARLFRVPIVHSTVNVKSGRGKPTVSPLGELLKDDPPVDRTSTNAWEDADFVRAVRATGRRKLIFCALWTEICMAFPALDALREGYEVYPVVDAIGGTSLEAPAVDGEEPEARAQLPLLDDARVAEELVEHPPTVPETASAPQHCRETPGSRC